MATAAIGVAALGAIPALGADHKDAPLTKAAPMSDINDLYAFKGAGGGAVLAMTVNPLTSPADTPKLQLDPSTVYEIKADTTGDAVADWAYKFTVSGTGSVQDVTVRLAKGAAAVSNDPAGDIIAQGKTSANNGVTTITGSNGAKFYVGPRDDPFFFDLGAFNKGLAFTSPGVDTFKGTNITAIVVEESTPATGKAGYWATTSRMDNVGKWAQLDRMGRPAILTVFVPVLDYLGDKSPSQEDAYNNNNPDRDVALFHDVFVETLNTLKSDPKLADILLPDVLTVDWAAPVKYLNGRALADDVIDISLAVITGNAAASDNVPANDNAFLTTFPYLAGPNGITPPTPPNTGTGATASDGTSFIDYSLPAGLIAGAILLAGATFVGRRRTASDRA
ncbi:hypothetical protein AYO38_11155 [bacterium SCGC AG-212-C10]|nr:hypothetical protein AYO38_11155 [bacterium SCGC AG-212-C10]